MSSKASFILTMAIVLVGLPACARQQYKRQQAYQQQQRQQYGAGYGGETNYQVEEQRRGAGHDATSRLSTEEQMDQQRAEQEVDEIEEIEDVDALSANEENQEIRQERMAEACPMSVEGAEVKSREVPNGVALVFTTEEEDVTELRLRVDRFAQLHNEQSAAPTPESGVQSSHHQGMGMGMEHGKVASRAEVEEIDRGAQVIYTPRDPSELADLRRETKEQAQQMSGGECPMMSAAGAEATGG